MTSVTFKLRYSTICVLLAGNVTGFAQETSVPPSGPTVLVRDLGAVGDGRADDTAPLQAALDSGATIIDVSPGTYRITRTLMIRSNKHLRLAPAATIRRGAPIDAMLLNASNGAGGYDGGSNIVVSGGTWDGAATQFATACTLIAFGHARDIAVRDTALVNTPVWHSLELNATLRARVERVRFDGCANEALQLDTPAPQAHETFPWFGPWDDTKNSDTLITDCTFTNVATAVGSHTNPPAENVVIRRCVVVATTDRAIKPVSYDGLTIEDCDFVACSTVLAGRSTNLVFRNNRVARSVSADIDLLGVVGGSVESNRITARRTGITNADSTVVLRNNQITELPSLPSATGRFANMAVRTRVASGDSLVLGLVVVDGRGSYLIRAAGPALTDFQLADTMMAPSLELRNEGGELIRSNRGWLPDTAAAMAGVGAFAFRAGSKDAALVTDLDSGNYTVEVRGADGAGGIVLIEAYDLRN